MNLYEITTGGWGESYLRAYAWAASEEQAIKMGEVKFGMAFSSFFDDKRLLIKIRLLFSVDAEPFCTPFSDTGFDDDYVCTQNRYIRTQFGYRKEKT